MPPIRVYADTSVFGGVFDDEFRDASQAFFDEVKDGRFQLVTSPIVRRELARAPGAVINLFREMLGYSENVDTSEDALRLRTAYLNSNVVTQRWADDALHVAIASVSGCSLLVSWNFKHIVHFQKIPLYNAVNTLNGYDDINNFSPLEVLHYEE